ncbi:hypothetical protein Tco_0647735 [Tanacetum coccineum]
MMKRRDVKGLPSTDLLVIPTISHLALMPKTTSSPNNHRHQQHHRGKSIGGVAGDGGSWSKKNRMGPELSEPTSPKVTCVGQIKARPKSRSCKNWQTVMEEIDRLNNKKHRKKLTLGDALGFKKESMQFLTSLRSFKFDLGCFGAFPNANIPSDDDDDDDDIVNDDDLDDHEKGSSRRAFSRWLMVCEENQDFGLLGKQEIDDQAQLPCVPPSNALILMRCRSAPVKSVVEDRHKDNNNHDNENDQDKENDYDQHENGDKWEDLTELMKYEGDFYKLSCDIAKETWVVGGINKDPCSSTQSSNRCSTECLEQVKACLS